MVDLAARRPFDAVRGGGARRNGEPIGPSAATALDQVAGRPVRVSARATSDGGSSGLWARRRSTCVRWPAGVLDGYIDCLGDAHGAWDYLGGMLVCLEAGAPVVDAHGRDLVVLDHHARRTPVAAATPALLDELVAARHW